MERQCGYDRGLGPIERNSSGGVNGRVRWTNDFNRVERPSLTLGTQLESFFGHRQHRQRSSTWLASFLTNPLTRKCLPKQKRERTQRQVLRFNMRMIVGLKCEKVGRSTPLASSRRPTKRWLHGRPAGWANIYCGQKERRSSGVSFLWKSKKKGDGSLVWQQTSWSTGGPGFCSLQQDQQQK